MLLNHPQLLRFSCAECRQFVYDLKTGERAKTCNGQVDVIRIKGPDGEPNTPCKECPKVGPEHEKEFLLTEANRKTYQLYLETQATAGGRLSEPMKEDRLLMRNFAILHSIVESAKETKRSRDLAQLVAAVLKHQ